MSWKQRHSNWLLSQKPFYISFHLWVLRKSSPTHYATRSIYLHDAYSGWSSPGVFTPKGTQWNGHSQLLPRLERDFVVRQGFTVHRILDRRCWSGIEECAFLQSWSRPVNPIFLISLYPALFFFNLTPLVKAAWYVTGLPKMTWF